LRLPRRVHWSRGQVGAVDHPRTDGGYGYGTRHLAVVKYRAQQLRADRILEVIDPSQHLRVQTVWENRVVGEPGESALLAP
jgi:arginyl-tRNA synthetase